MEKRYDFTWEIPVWAKNIEDAIQHMLERFPARDNDSIATVFKITVAKGGGWEPDEILVDEAELNLAALIYPELPDDELDETREDILKTLGEENV